MTATSFDRARRRRAYRRLTTFVRPRRSTELLPLDEATRRLRPFARRPLGVRSIPVSQIVGTDSRAADFDRDFLPRRAETRTRWRSVEQAFPEGMFPPISAYKLGDAYFIIDGHHRVAIARQHGMATIDADVTELTARWKLPADADLVELIHAEQERIFMDATGLAAVRPDAYVRFSKPVGYLLLTENVQLHGYHLMMETRRALTPGEIAADWYERVYLPLVEAIRTEKLQELHPGLTDADFFLCVFEQRRQLYPEEGCVPLATTARRMAEEAQRRRGRLPHCSHAAA
jgi:ParB-like nuclease domain